MNVPVPVAGSRISTPSSPKRLAKMFEAQMVGRFNHKTHNFVGRVDNAQAVGGFGVVRFVEVFVEHLEEFLLFLVVVDLGGAGLDDAGVAFDAAVNLAAHFACVKSTHHVAQFMGNNVFAVELRFVKDGDEDVFGEHVLHNHFAHVGFFHAGVDRFLAQFQKLFGGFLEGGVASGTGRESVPAVLRPRRECRA